MRYLAGLLFDLWLTFWYAVEEGGKAIDRAWEDWHE